MKKIMSLLSYFLAVFKGVVFNVLFLYPQYGSFVRNANSRDLTLEVVVQKFWG